MDRREAFEVASGIGEEVLGWPAERVARLLEEKHVRTVRSAAGAEYCAVVEAWDESDDERRIHVVVAVADGGWSALRPVSWNDWITG